MRKLLLGGLVGLCMVTPVTMAQSPSIAVSLATIPVTTASYTEGALRALGLHPSAALPVAAVCCKVCSVGKACGNTCISRDKTCHVGPGCACDG